MHRIIGSALSRLGVVCRAASKQEREHSVLCFQQCTPGDLLLGESKIVGSAQRRQKGCLLQHGAVLLRASPHAPQLPGILEQSGRDLSPGECQAAIVEEFLRDTGWEMYVHPWDRREEEMISQLAVEKYSCAEWNNKR
jgi:lipoate-protein ligase A